MDQRLFFCSHSLNLLAKGISDQIQAVPFRKNLIISPSKQINQWLKIELCKRSKRRGFIGIDFVDWKSALRKLAKNTVWPDRVQLIAKIWNELQGEPHKKWKLASRLSSLFLDYFFDEFQPTGWQNELFQKFFPISLAEILSEAESTNVSLFLFGLDALPKSVEDFLFRHPNVQEYRFAPSAMFWQDLRSPKEQIRYAHKLKNKGVKTEALEKSYELDHAFLAMWGRLGRGRSDLPGDVLEGDNFEFDEECKAALHQLQRELLLLEMPQKRLHDSSVQVVKAGISRIREVEIAKNRILEAAAKKIPFAQMGVYVTDMEQYEPIIEFVFGDSIPLRIEGSKSFNKSPFYQGLLSLFRCFETRWSKEAVLELFENSSFRTKVGWSEQESALLQDWVRRGSVRWALDGEERGKAEGSWEYGLCQVAEGWVFLRPEKERVTSWSEFEPLNRFWELLSQIKKRCASWKEEKSLLDWGQEISQLIEEVLQESSADKEGCVREFLSSLKNGENSQQYPFFFVRKLFDQFGKATVGGASLHTIRCAELGKDGAFPADLVIVLGLDEENHPRKTAQDSLDQKPYSKTRDEDRYALLKTIFAAREELCLVYRDLSEEDGKEMGPSLILQELVDHLQIKPIRLSQTSKQSSSSLLQTCKRENEESFEEVSLEELLRFFRNSIGFYLDRVLGIDLGEEPESAWAEFEVHSFEWSKLLKNQLAASSEGVFDIWPLGVFGEEAKKRLTDQLEEWRESLQNHAIDPSSLQSLLIQVEGVMGEASGAVSVGVLHFGADQIGGYLRRWPELLAVLAQTNTHQIIPLKGKNIREVKDPRDALQRLKRFYLKYRTSLVPLHPEWIDPMLRKNRLPDASSQDRILKWAIDRSPEWDLHQEKKLWESELRETLLPLLDLFPQKRGADAEI